MTDVVAQIMARVAELPRALVCIDGPAGAGKTTLATELARALNDTSVITMDALYDGWDDALSADLTDRLVAQIRDPFVAGASVRFHRYDWMAGAFTDTVDLGTPRRLVVEGVGSAQRVMRAHAALTVFLDVAPDLGRTRVLARDGEPSAAQIDRWQVQERTHFDTDGTRAAVDLYVP